MITDTNTNWDGTICQYVNCYSLITWHKRWDAGTRCVSCGGYAQVSASIAYLVDPERVPAHDASDTPAVRREADAFQAATTREQCHGAFFRGATRPLCKQCAINIAYVYFTGGSAQDRDYAHAVAEAFSHDWTALGIVAEPGPDSRWEQLLLSGNGKASPERLAMAVRQEAAHAYVDHQGLRAAFLNPQQGEPHE